MFEIAEWTSCGWWIIAEKSIYQQPMLIYKPLLFWENSCVLCSVCHANFMCIFVFFCTWHAWLHWIMGAVHSDILKTCLISSYVMIMRNITRYYGPLSHQIIQSFSGTWVLIYYYAVELILGREIHVFRVCCNAAIFKLIISSSFGWGFTQRSNVQILLMCTQCQVPLALTLLSRLSINGIFWGTSPTGYPS